MLTSSTNTKKWIGTGSGKCVDFYYRAAALVYDRWYKDVQSWVPAKMAWFQCDRLKAVRCWLHITMATVFIVFMGHPLVVGKL